MRCTSRISLFKMDFFHQGGSAPKIQVMDSHFHYRRIILDLLLNRQPFCDMTARVIDRSVTKVIEGYVSASAITDIYYLAYRTIRDKIKFFLYWKSYYSNILRLRI